MASKLSLEGMAETRREDRIGVVLNDNIVKVRSQRTFYTMESWILSYSLLKSGKELKAGSFMVRCVFQKNLSGSSMECGCGEGQGWRQRDYGEVVVAQPGTVAAEWADMAEVGK